MRASSSVSSGCRPCGGSDSAHHRRQEAATRQAIRHTLSRHCCCPSIAGWPRRSNPGRRSRGSPRLDREQRVEWGERIHARACATAVSSDAPWRHSLQHSEQAISPGPKRTASSLFPIERCQPDIWFGRQSSPSAGGFTIAQFSGMMLRCQTVRPRSPSARWLTKSGARSNAEALNVVGGTARIKPVTAYPFLAVAFSTV